MQIAGEDLLMYFFPKCLEPKEHLQKNVRLNLESLFQTVQVLMSLARV